MTIARTVSLLGLIGAAWALTVDLALDAGFLPALGFVLLLAGAAFGVGYELENAGTAAAVFLLLAAGAVAMTLLGVANRLPGAELALLLGSAPALIAAGGAYAGGALRERSSSADATTRRERHAG